MYNPKVSKLIEIDKKKVNKNAIKNFGKNYNSPDKMGLFFIKLDHTYSDNSVAPLFIFGKIKHLKPEYKKAKSNMELSGLAYMETAEDGTKTLCLSPEIGKLDKKLSLLSKTMKAIFSAVFCNVKLLPTMTPEQIAAMEAKAETIVDEPEEADDTTPENNTDKSDSENDADTNTDDAPVKVKLKTLAAEIRGIVDIIADKSKRTPELIEKLKKSALSFYQAFNDANIIIRTLFQKSYKFVSDLLIQLKLEPAPTPPTPTPPTPTPEPNKATPEQETIFTESTTKIKELFLKMGITLAI